MIRLMKFLLIATAAYLSVVCASVSAQNYQVYNTPTISNVQSRAITPDIGFQTSTMLQRNINSGFGGVRNPALPAPMPSSGGGSRINFGVNTSSRGSKPFSSYQSAPTVSPYLNLFRTDLQGGGNFNYSTLVQPQLQQQQMNQQLERQNLQTNRRLQSIAAQSAFNPQGSKDEYPTGHQTVYNYMGHYYQAPSVKQKRTR